MNKKEQRAFIIRVVSWAVTIIAFASGLAFKAGLDWNTNEKQSGDIKMLKEVMDEHTEELREINTNMALLKNNRDIDAKEMQDIKKAVYILLQRNRVAVKDRPYHIEKKTAKAEIN